MLYDLDDSTLDINSRTSMGGLLGPTRCAMFVCLCVHQTLSLSTLQKCKGYYNLGVVISVASVQRVPLYPHDYCVQTSHRDSNCYILLPELVVKDCKSTAIMRTPEQMQLR